MAGYAGWMFLKRTAATQLAAYSAQASVTKDSAYFREKIGGIKSAEELVSDQRLLRVALSAHGLEADLPNKFFIKKVLQDGTLDPKALSNRLADKRYSEFAKAFGFGDFSTPRTKLSDFADKLLKKFVEKQFQASVGEQNSSFRIAMNAETQLKDLARSSTAESSKWFSVLGSPPLREVFEKAFGLPPTFAAIDLDKQVEVLQDRTRTAFGSAVISQFSDEEKIDKLVRMFVIRSETADYAANVSRGQIALTLLQQGAYRSS
ncbi:DUF1217 domain-containing protein [Thioclava sp. FR2]|uniref:DUF1217 domain-containing protein n=1 Tax=Thioclava sp. FR2 TaxID=3445780 RepID=UPI003EBCA010